MAKSNRCPNCGAVVSPYAAGCSICGEDLEAHRRHTAPAKPSFRKGIPATSGDTTELVVATVVLILLALFAPLIGALVCAFAIWQSDRTSKTALRNIAIGCLALAIFNLFDPGALGPSLWRI